MFELNGTFNRDKIHLDDKFANCEKCRESRDNAGIVLVWRDVLDFFFFERE